MLSIFVCLLAVCISLAQDDSLSCDDVIMMRYWLSISS